MASRHGPGIPEDRACSSIARSLPARPPACGGCMYVCTTVRWRHLSGRLRKTPEPAGPGCSISASAPCTPRRPQRHCEGCHSINCIAVMPWPSMSKMTNGMPCCGCEHRFSPHKPPSAAPFAPNEPTTSLAVLTASLRGEETYILCTRAFFISHRLVATRSSCSYSGSVCIPGQASPPLSSVQTHMVQDPHSRESARPTETKG
ncbi:hypothetical protein BCR34DRAFT_385878 [Clohesyomyces aquaticus]|uniref:Uncharacterized protein n=1 Tax=Clohesyomyces aquaticus TaxID=1231657 RepID=A0A1Y1ZF75_9PLEO|nr:hypothetical protein BCR34DRAFT_385878 [Clohesyomyces aquaticus]